jgi:hypothetical protein
MTTRRCCGSGPAATASCRRCALNPPAGCTPRCSSSLPAASRTSSRRTGPPRSSASTSRMAPPLRPGTIWPLSTCPTCVASMHTLRAPRCPFTHLRNGHHGRDAARQPSPGQLLTLDLPRNRRSDVGLGRRRNGQPVYLVRSGLIIDLQHRVGRIAYSRDRQSRSVLIAGCTRRARSAVGDGCRAARQSSAGRPSVDVFVCLCEMPASGAASCCPGSPA